MYQLLRANSRINLVALKRTNCCHIPIILAHLRDQGIRTNILTNGLALEPCTVKKLKDVEVSGVGISLDGLESTHDAIRGYKGLYRSVLDSIHQLQEVNIPVTVLTTANGTNISELPCMFDFLCSAGVKRWQIQPVFPLGRARDFPQLNLSEKTYIQLGMFIKKYESEAKKEGIELLPADSFGYFTEFDARTPSWQGCHAGLLSCGITSDGKVKGCLSMPDSLIEGDLRKKDLWEIWFNEESFAYTRNFSSEQLGVNCKSCNKGRPV